MSSSPPAGGFGAGPAHEAPPAIATAPARSGTWKVIAIVLAIPASLYAIAVAVCELHVEVISDDRGIYVQGLVRERGTPVRYRLRKADAYVLAAMDDNDYYPTIPLSRDQRPRVGRVPFDLEYRSFLGFTRHARLALDMDDEQIRNFEMGLGSAGWKQIVHFEGDDARLNADNERCIRWRYGLDGAKPTIELPVGQRTIPARGARTVTVRPSFCQWHLATCTVTVARTEKTESYERDSATEDCGFF